MIRAVLDTNVLVSGYISLRSRHSVPALLLRYWREQRFELVTSDHIINEVQRVLNKPYFRARLDEETARRTILRLRQYAISVPVSHRVQGVAPDANDDRVLATALSAGVPYLVTGDAASLDVGAYEGVTLVSPRRFLAILAEDTTR